MPLDILIIDAFADRPFAGNPAAVCPLGAWLPDATMQAIAAEMNLSETVFFVPDGDRFAIRWFTPIREVDMIGHATLAAGHWVLERMRPGSETVEFTSKGDVFRVSRSPAGLAMEMPSLPPSPIAPLPELERALGRKPQTVMAAKHYLAIYAHEEDVAGLAPDFAELKRLTLPAIIVTAPATNGGDFVSRFFAPANGVDEDPVSGVAHLCLTPYWSKRLGKQSLVGRQLSRRGGVILCEDRGPRVLLGGSAVVVMEGRLSL